jgi:hypothetical protein
MFRGYVQRELLPGSKRTNTTGKPFAAKVSLNFFVIDLSKFQGLVKVALWCDNGGKLDRRSQKLDSGWR